MTQEILNLLLNALQAIKNDGRIEVGAELNPSDSILKIWVEDEGPGIKVDQRDKIFAPLF